MLWIMFQNTIKYVEMEKKYIIYALFSPLMLANRFLIDCLGFFIDNHKKVFHSLS